MHPSQGPWKAFLPIHARQWPGSTVPGPTALASPEHLLEIQVLRLHPRTSELDHRCWGQCTGIFVGFMRATDAHSSLRSTTQANVNHSTCCSISNTGLNWSDSCVLYHIIFRKVRTGITHCSLTSGLYCKGIEPGDL